jgi:peptidoglycan LD-endopeptidase CwlK
MLFQNLPGQNYVLIDSNIPLEEALQSGNFPEFLRKDLVIVDVLYYSFDDQLHKGQVVIHKELEKDIIDVFALILQDKFPIGSAIPVSKYNWSDSLSMSNNNTSAFNFRKVKGTKKLSSHSLGRAIDINPWLNPQIKRNQKFPPGSSYNPELPGTLTRESPVVEFFIKRGWSWGGNWRSTKDYQHFEKN